MLLQAGAAACPAHGAAVLPPWRRYVATSASAAQSAAAAASESPKAALVIIGDEVLAGSITDTNTPWLAKLLHRWAPENPGWSGGAPVRRQAGCGRCCGSGCCPGSGCKRGRARGSCRWEAARACQVHPGNPVIQPRDYEMNLAATRTTPHRPRNAATPAAAAWT